MSKTITLNCSAALNIFSALHDFTIFFCDEFGGCSSVYYYYYYCSYSFYTETLKTQKGLRVTVASEEDDTKKNLRYGKKKQSYVYTVRY